MMVINLQDDDDEYDADNRGEVDGRRPEVVASALLIAHQAVSRLLSPRRLYAVLRYLCPARGTKACVPS